MRSPFTAAREAWRRRRALRIAAYVIAGLVAAAAVADRALDRPLRGVVERRLNRNLIGYTAKVGRSNFHLIGLALELRETVVTQDAHPQPPVISLPRLRLSVHWTDLLYGRVVADATFDRPVVHANLEQLQGESKDPVPIGRHGWQQALESIYPLKINELAVRDGTAVYQEKSGDRPLELTAVSLVATNIRNVRSKQRTYPSSFTAKARVFEVGSARIEGRADFLAEPMPGLTGTIELDKIELAYFQPVAKRLGFTIHRGLLGGNGVVEWGPGIQSVDLHALEITGASVDYESTGQPTPLAEAAGQKITQVAKSSLNNPEVLFKARKVLVRDGSFTVISKAKDATYRLEFSKADLALTNLSSRAEDGPARAVLSGAFMKSGTMKAEATFFPEGEHANVAGKVVIEDTPLASMNDLLRAKGKFDVSRGTFSLYSEFRVKDGAVQGYVKPLFRDVKVLDAEQDKHKSVVKKMYEGIIGLAAKLLKNKNGEVATVTSLNGPLENPKANAMEALGGLLRNAFVKAILPGFRNEIQRIEPVRYRAALKSEQKPTTQ